MQMKWEAEEILIKIECVKKAEKHFFSFFSVWGWVSTALVHIGFYEIYCVVLAYREIANICNCCAKQKQSPHGSHLNPTHISSGIVNKCHIKLLDNLISSCNIVCVCVWEHRLKLWQQSL